MSKRHWNKRLNQIGEDLEEFVDNLRKSNDMWRLSQDEVAEKILGKYQELSNKHKGVDRQ